MQKKRCLALFFLLPALALLAQEEDAATAIAAMVEDNIETLGGDTVAVFPFPYVDGIRSVEGALLAERAATLLGERGRVRVVDRSRLDAVMAEQKLTAMGLTDAATGVRVGKLLGARGIVAGSVTDMGENIEVHARLLDTETGAVAATLQITARKTIKTFISPLWNRIESIKANSPAFHIEAWLDDETGAAEIPSRRIGDCVTLCFKADRDCYVTLFDFTTSGSIHVLFPNAFAPDNHVRAGRTYRLPKEDAGYKIRVNGPPGIERVKFFATAKDVPLFEEDYATESFRSITQQDDAQVRDLEVVIGNLGANAWAERRLELRIERPLR